MGEDQGRRGAPPSRGLRGGIPGLPVAAAVQGGGQHCPQRRSAEAPPPGRPGCCSDPAEKSPGVSEPRHKGARVAMANGREQVNPVCKKVRSCWPCSARRIVYLASAPGCSEVRTRYEDLASTFVQNGIGHTSSTHAAPVCGCVGSFSSVAFGQASGYAVGSCVAAQVYPLERQGSLMIALPGNELVQAAPWGRV